MSLARKKKAVQKIVIPKGIINPMETTIIEIPENLHNQPVVIAKKKHKHIEELADISFRPLSNSSTTEQLYTAQNQTSSANYSQQSECFSARTLPQSTSLGANYQSTKRPRMEFPKQDNRNDLAGLDFDLDKTELMERQALQKDLEDFQRARRRLLLNTSYLASTPHMKALNDSTALL